VGIRGGVGVRKQAPRRGLLEKKTKRKGLKRIYRCLRAKEKKTKGKPSIGKKKRDNLEWDSNDKKNAQDGQMGGRQGQASNPQKEGRQTYIRQEPRRIKQKI